MEAIISLVVILVTSFIDYLAGKRFAEASSHLGDHFKLPKSVKGATFDAIASSFPELMVALYSVIAFHKFEVGIGTIAGSALFNLLIIPGICILIAPVVFKVSKDVVRRDAVYYFVAVLALIIMYFAFGTWGIIVPIVFLGIYVFYIRDIVIHTAKSKVKGKKINFRKELSVGLLMMGIIAIATYFLTKHAILFAKALNVSPVLIAFTIVAAATSIPDAIISFVNAKKGNIDDATSNVFGSNVFDILVGLGLPLVIAYFLIGPVDIMFNHVEVLIGLLIATLVVIGMMFKSFTLTKKKGIILLLMYGVFLVYFFLI